MSLSLMEFYQKKAEDKAAENYTIQSENERKIIEKLSAKKIIIDPREEKKKKILSWVVAYKEMDLDVMNKFLNESYSRIILHKDKKQFTPRETICDFMDHICIEFSGIRHNETKNVNCYLTKLFEIYKEFMKQSSFSVRRQQATFKYFKEYFAEQCVLRWYKPSDEFGKQTGKKLLVQGLPDLRDNWEWLDVKVKRNRKEVVAES